MSDRSSFHCRCRSLTAHHSPLFLHRKVLLSAFRPDFGPSTCTEPNYLGSQRRDPTEWCKPSCSSIISLTHDVQLEQLSLVVIGSCPALQYYWHRFRNFSESCAAFSRSFPVIYLSIECHTTHRKAESMTEHQNDALLFAVIMTLLRH